MDFEEHLDEAIVTGKAQNEVSKGQKPIFEILYSDSALLKGIY